MRLFRGGGEDLARCGSGSREKEPTLFNWLQPSASPAFARTRAGEEELAAPSSLSRSSWLSLSSQRYCTSSLKAAIRKPSRASPPVHAERNTRKLIRSPATRGGRATPITHRFWGPTSPQLAPRATRLKDSTAINVVEDDTHHAFRKPTLFARHRIRRSISSFPQVDRFRIGSVKLRGRSFEAQLIASSHPVRRPRTLMISRFEHSIITSFGLPFAPLK